MLTAHAENASVGEFYGSGEHESLQMEILSIGERVCHGPFHTRTAGLNLISGGRTRSKKPSMEALLLNSWSYSTSVGCVSGCRDTVYSLDYSFGSWGIPFQSTLQLKGKVINLFGKLSQDQCRTHASFSTKVRSRYVLCNGVGRVQHV